MNDVDNVLAITELYIPPNVEDQINDELLRINTLLHKYTDQKQRNTLLQRLKAINDDLFVDLEELQQPKNAPKKGRGKDQEKHKKRDLIALEYQEQESKKKAKTSFGHKSAEIWYLFISNN